MKLFLLLLPPLRKYPNSLSLGSPRSRAWARPAHGAEEGEPTKDAAASWWLLGCCCGSLTAGSSGQPAESSGPALWLTLGSGNGGGGRHALRCRHVGSSTAPQSALPPAVESTCVPGTHSPEKPRPGASRLSLHAAGPSPCRPGHGNERGTERTGSGHERWTRNPGF